MTSRQHVFRVGLLLGLSGCAVFDPNSGDSADRPLGPGGGGSSGNTTGGSGSGVDAGFGNTGDFFPDGGLPGPPPKRLGKVTSAAHVPPPISGGTLSVTPDGKVAIASDPDRDAIHVARFDVTDLTKQVTTIQLDPGAEPGRVALDTHGVAHVVLRGKGQLAAVDIATGTLTRTASVCANPRGLAFQGAGDRLLVACAGGDLVSLSATSYAELARTTLDRDLRDVVVTSKGELYVSRYRSAELLKLTASLEVAQYLVPRDGQSFRSSMSADGTFQPFTTMTPTLAWRALAGKDGNVLMLHQRSQVEQVSLGVGGYGGGSCETITQPGITSISPTGVVSAPFNGIGDAPLAVDMAQSPDGQWFAVASPGDYMQANPTLKLYRANVVVPDMPTLGSLGEVDGGLPPGPVGGGCATAEAGGVGDGQAIAVAFDAQGWLYVQSREPAQLSIFHVTEGEFLELLSTRPLDDRSVTDTGHDLFHADVGGGMTCASCHGEALDDGHVWNFQGIGPRRTQNMRGGLKGTEPFHWDGDMTTFQHLVDEVMTKRMRGFQVEPQYANAVLSWIDAQPALRLPASDVNAAQRGKALFESNQVGCTSCHSGTAMTNNASVDVGTGGKFQVPSLHGLALRAPYMHTGCAKTLADRFSPACGGTNHGNTDSLSKSQIADLISYLETL